MNQSKQRSVPSFFYISLCLCGYVSCFQAQETKDPKPQTLNPPKRDHKGLGNEDKEGINALSHEVWRLGQHKSTEDGQSCAKTQA